MRPSGSFPASISPIKDTIDFWLTRVPRLYLNIERFRHWINWDKRLYLSLIRRGDIVLDIGANVGTHAVMFSHLVGKSGQVLAFEPVPASFERLLETIRKRSRFANVRTFQTAVGNPGASDDHTVIMIPGDDLTHASLKIQTGGEWEKQSVRREYRCAITSIDAQIFQAPPAHLDFVKIDVEGGELDALRGGAKTLSRYRPLVYCEVYEKWMAAFGYTPADLFTFLGSMGYSGARVMRGGAVHAHGIHDSSAERFDVSSNVLFFAEKHARIVETFDKRFHVHTN